MFGSALALLAAILTPQSSKQIKLSSLLSTCVDASSLGCAEVRAVQAQRVRSRPRHAGDDGAYDHTEILDGDVDIVFAAHVVGEWSSMRFDACDSAGAGSGKPWSVATFDELRNFVHAHILPALNIVRWQSDWTLATTIEGHELQIAGQRSWRRAQAHWVRHHAKEAEVRLNFAAAGRAFIQSCSPHPILRVCSMARPRSPLLRPVV
jgi:hypothetical protein